MCQACDARDQAQAVLEVRVQEAVQAAAEAQMALGVQPGSTLESTRALRTAASQAMASHAAELGIMILRGEGLLGAFEMHLDPDAGSYQVRWATPDQAQAN